MTLRPFSISMVEEFFTDNNFHYQLVPERSMLLSKFEDTLYRFIEVGEDQKYFYAEAQLAGTIEASQKMQLVDLCNSWNRQHYAPKSYVQEADDALVVMGDFTVNTFAGLTQSQVVLYVTWFLDAGRDMSKFFVENAGDLFISD